MFLVRAMDLERVGSFGVGVGWYSLRFIADIINIRQNPVFYKPSKHLLTKRISFMKDNFFWLVRDIMMC